MKHGQARYGDGCRCDVCRAAHAAASKSYRDRNREARTDYERRYRKEQPAKQKVKTSQPCAYCGAEFNAWNMGAERLKRLGRFCSLKCANASRVKPAGQRTNRRLLRLPGHPLATTDGRVLEYRAILYDAIGPGSHPCHWCRRVVTWTVRVGAGAGREELAVDHLDGDKHNNDPLNLVPACNDCNTLRAYIAGWVTRTGRPITDLL